MMLMVSSMMTKTATMIVSHLIIQMTMIVPTPVTMQRIMMMRMMRMIILTMMTMQTVMLLMMMMIILTMSPQVRRPAIQILWCAAACKTFRVWRTTLTLSGRKSRSRGTSGPTRWFSTPSSFSRRLHVLCLPSHAALPWHSTTASKAYFSGMHGLAVLM